MRMYGRRKLSIEETAANAKRKVEREAATMTCQCCGRKHLANRGWIAHHGYQRPGYGYQTASCFGAKALPFEVDRSKLGQWINMLKYTKLRMGQVLTEVVAERSPITLTHSFIDYRYGGRYGYAAYRKERTVKFNVTRANWNSVVAAEDNADIFRMKGWTNFEDMKLNDVESRIREINNIADDIKTQIKRYYNWKQTHKWNEEKKEWEGV